MDDVIINKVTTIHRCLARINEVYLEAGEKFINDYTRQDSTILNLQSACEASIDLANYVNKLNQFGVPQSSRDSFNLLVTNRVITKELGQNLMKMVGLGNIAVHDYQKLNVDILEHIIKHHLGDFTHFTKVIKKVTPALSKAEVK